MIQDRARRRLVPWPIVQLLFSLALVCTVAAAGGVAPMSLAAQERVVAFDYEEQEVYHSPQSPGWTGWVCLLKMRDGEVRLSFLQITGDVKRPPVYDMAGLKKEEVLLRSKDGGKTWQPISTLPVPEGPQPAGWVYNGGAFVAAQQLSDGSLLGARWGRGFADRRDGEGLVFRSTDGGARWSGPQAVNDLREFSCYPSRLRQLRDGTVMLAYEGRKMGYAASSRWQHAGVYLSRDLGKTWEGPDIIAPDDDGLVAYPEPAFVEFEDGSLLFVFRIENYPDLQDESKYHAGRRRQCRVTKRRGYWAAGPIVETVLPHGGHPELLLTKEGILLYVSKEGYWSSLDKGSTWTKLDLTPSAYYPHAVQLDDGRILVVGHVGEDNPFPPPQDMSIRCQRFRLRREAPGPK